MLFAYLIRKMQKLINYANMQISMMGKLYGNVLSYRNMLAKFQTKILPGRIKLWVWRFIHKILVKIGKKLYSWAYFANFPH